ncbi:MAG: hypothetical protein U0T82_05210 [Bacteroidales bacterium]
MIKHWFSLIALTGCIFSLTSCGSGNSNPAGTESADSAQVYLALPDSLSAEEMKEGLPIFYNMYLSVDMARLFESAGAVYNPEILNSVGNEKNYVTSGKKALNLGVYSVDLGYIRAYEQYEKTRAYFDAMRNLSSALGIPEEFFLKSAERYDKNIADKDSLIFIANEVYAKTTGYLKENERESASALIVVGGWVEAIYIATRMINSSDKDAELIEKIADQKTSIASLLEMAGKYRDDKDVAAMCTKLEDLKTSFDKLSVDPANLKASSPALNEVSDKVAKLRSVIIK